MIDINTVTWKFPATMIAILIVYAITNSLIFAIIAFFATRKLFSLLGKGCLIIMVFGICGTFGVNFVYGIDQEVLKTSLENSLIVAAVIMAIEGVYFLTMLEGVRQAMIAGRNLPK